ncbi:VOC family protein [Glutamicibacter endophyticus]|uniref:VOC family protein n=1 Tax=Glutamicibacter endophyticus TaxID=1522174 RepID=UPI003AF0189F
MARVGDPVWIDLAYRDPKEFAEFYAGLFGWRSEDMGEDFGHYQMLSTPDGTMIGGAAGPQPGAPQEPVGWNVYLAAEHLEELLAQVPAAGGMVLDEAMPVGELGTMARVATPSGASVGLWQRDEFAGFGAEATQGTPVWFEQMSQGYAADVEFYRQTLGWEPAEIEGGLNYVTNRPEREATAGLCDAAGFLPASAGSYWRVYFQCDDVDAGVERVIELGGALLDGPMDSPFGRLATVADREGGSFQIIASAAR